MRREHDSRRQSKDHRSSKYKKRKCEDTSDSNASVVSSTISASYSRNHKRRNRGSSLDHAAGDVQRLKRGNPRRGKHRSRISTIADDSEYTEILRKHSKEQCFNYSSDSHSLESVEGDFSYKSGKEKSPKSSKSSHKKKKKKKKKKSSTRTSLAVDQNEYGKYGIIRESDFQSKCVSFQAWLRDVKQLQNFNGSKREVMEFFREYMEDFNTATLPHDKFYDIEAYEMKEYAKKQSKNKHRNTDHGRNPRTDEEYMRKERQAARERQDKDKFKALLQTMDTEKVRAMRSQEQLRVQMQTFYKAGNVEEARRLEKLLNKEDLPQATGTYESWK